MRYLITITLLITWGHTHSQDLHFTLPHNVPLWLNPALTGSMPGNMRASATYKDQWGSVSRPYRTILAGYDMRMLVNRWNNGYLGGGIAFWGDQAGTSRIGIYQANLSLASHVYLSNDQILSAGLQGGFGNRSMDPVGMQWGNQYNGSYYDPNRPSGESLGNAGFWFGDISTGVQWRFMQSERYSTANDVRSFQVGAAIHHVNRPDISFTGVQEDRLYMRYSLHGRGMIGIPNTNFMIEPVVLAMIQGPNRLWMAGNFFNYRVRDASHYTGYIEGALVGFGAFYRVGDALAPAIQAEVGSYKMALSYDINISHLTVATQGRGGLEITFIYVNPNPFEKTSQTTPMF